MATLKVEVQRLLPAMEHSEVMCWFAAALVP
jgi:hypothetical protein